MSLEPLEPYHHPIGSISSCAHARPKQCELGRFEQLYMGGIVCGDSLAARAAREGRTRKLGPCAVAAWLLCVAAAVPSIEPGPPAAHISAAHAISILEPTTFKHRQV